MKQSKFFKGRSTLRGFPRFLQELSDPARKSIDVAPMTCQLRLDVGKGLDFEEFVFLLFAGHYMDTSCNAIRRNEMRVSSSSATIAGH